MELVPGIEIGDGYSIVEEIARGSMGTLYRASQLSTGRLVAIRVLLPALTTQPGFPERFEREAKTLASLRHSNIVPLLDSGEQYGSTYLVTELIEGGTLATLTGMVLGVEGVVTMLEPVAAALDYAHGRGVVHGDINPATILLAGDGRPVLADFGLLGLVTDGKPLSGLRGVGGLLVGTPAYMAPEIANDAPLTPAIDLYALAVVAYELLTGKVPYTADAPAAVLMAHVLQPLPPPRSLNSLLPAAVDTVLLKALAKDPSERYTTAGVFVAALAAAAGQDDAGSHAARATMPSAAATPASGAMPTAVARKAGVPASTSPRPVGAATSSGKNAPSSRSPAPVRGMSAPSPLLLAGLGGALLVLLIGVVALTHRGGNGIASSSATATISATSSGAPRATAPPAARATAGAIAPTRAAASLPGPGVWRAAQAMHTARGSGQSAVLHDGRILVMGGFGADGPLADAELYDPATGRWTATGSMHVARRYFSATVLPSGRVLVAGGSDTESYFPDAELYDPATGSWTVTGSMDMPRDQHVAALLPSGSVLVAGGETTGTTPINTAELYDPGTGHWRVVAPMTAARWDATATLLADGTVLVAGGGSASSEIYDPATGRWRTTGLMSTVRYRHTATLLPDHTVLVAGGETSFTSLLDTAEIYNPRTGIWTSAGAMPHPHSRHTATLLPNGEVLVAGGSTGKDPQVTLESGTDSVDLYDPVRHRWFAAGALRSKRAEQSAVPLTGGRLLLVGGYTNQGSVTAETEIYSVPATR